ncbi:MAG: amino acid permease [Planctomycetota bacterium]|nr:MAG: amino acid permease [Planctomycetota bacterium]
MRFKQLFRRKSLEVLLAEMAGEHRLHRVLGPVALTCLGVGAIIGAGIFAITGRVAALESGPAIMISFVVASVACLFAALCYSEFAAMAPVAGSAYTYTYATLGEFFAWIIGWDLILEYAMSCSVVAAHWTGYFNEFLYLSFGWRIPPQWTSDPFTAAEGYAGQTYVNLPAMLVMLVITWILVVGIRESALTNAILVVVKLAVVLLVIVLGFNYVNREHWTGLPVEKRHVTDLADFIQRHPDLASALPPDAVHATTEGEDLIKAHPAFAAKLSPEEKAHIKQLPNEVKKWGLLGLFGVKDWLHPLDEAVRSPFAPYGFSGIMVGAALVFFSYIGFDSISTHAEEAVNPQRDVPIGIIGSLLLCTLLYMLVSAVITGMEPYYDIETKAPIAAAFRKQAEAHGNPLLNGSAWIISVGALAGMTSVLLVTFLSQSRIFLAMARDGLLPNSIFGVVHERYRTPHRSTMITGACIIVAAGLLPIRMLEEMVSIGTLLAFVMVCLAVLILRVTRPDVRRPFRAPAIWAVAPLGALVSFAMMAFLPLDTWARLIVWLGLGLAIYFFYGMHHSRLGHELQREIQQHGMSPTDAPLK